MDAKRQIDAWLETGQVPPSHELTPEQVAASRSHRLCVCGHKEMFHTIPDGDAPRECFPPETVDWDLQTGEEVIEKGCACEHFEPAVA